jgi:hypothetical protein
MSANPSAKPNLLARMVQAVTRRQPVPVLARSLTPAVSRRPMTADAQWARLNAVIVGSVDRAHGISNQHTQARDQLDAAAYALHLLLAELRPVMQLPARLLSQGATADHAPAFASAA